MELSQSERRKVHQYLHRAYLANAKKTLYREHPIITDGAKDFLEEFVRAHPGPRVLEFGCGGSTIWFARAASRLVSIEHDEYWFRHVGQRLCELGLEANVELICRDRPYHRAADGLSDGSMDLVLVDGRDRVECALASMRVLRSGGVLMLDNSERDRYSPVLETLRGWKAASAVQEEIVDRFGFTAGVIDWRTHWWIKP